MKQENLYKPHCVRTFSGQYVNVFNPDPATITIEDIAHHLSMQCRFGGALPDHYSVAQHSWLCSQMVAPQYRLAALLHDASEAYLIDLPAPIKREMKNYQLFEADLMTVIARKFGFQWPLPVEVQAADHQLLEQEWHCLMLGNWDQWKHTVLYMNPAGARSFFLKQYNELTQLQPVTSR